MPSIPHLRASVAAACLCLGAPASAQLRGTVRTAETREPLSFTIVTLLPQTTQQFTNTHGAFGFVGVSPGTYVLSIRQIAYAPLDTQIVIPEGGEIVVDVALRHLAIELPPVTVAAVPCTMPGPPDSRDTALVAIFEQLQENARRSLLLADTYPFHYVLELAERTIYAWGDTGGATISELRFSSGDNHPYQVGRVVEPAWGPWGDPETTVVIRSADLEDFANPRFVAAHCFRLAGRETIGEGGDSLVRIDFEPSTHIYSADMAGAAYLDPRTYELRYTVTSLTRPERSALRDVRSMTFRTHFTNIAPGVPLQDSLTAITTYRWGARAKIDTQRTLDIRFKRQPPVP